MRDKKWVLENRDGSLKIEQQKQLMKWDTNIRQISAITNNIPPKESKIKYQFLKLISLVSIICPLLKYYYNISFLFR